MRRLLIDPGNSSIGEILAFVDAAVKGGDDAAVPSSCLPVLAVQAKCCPARHGTDRGTYVFQAPSARSAQCRLCERLLALLLLVLFAPVLLAVTLLILAFDGHPVLFKQERFGKEGRLFTLFKFRTMVRRSEDLHEKLQQRLGQEGHLFKLERDPRVTRLGAFLRRTFLDELPQLVNVLRGEMRFVGPRPLPASDQGHYTQPYHSLRLKGMPGMTGLWQVSGRNARTFDEMCLLDYFYLSHCSRAMDARIALRTAGLLFKQISLKREAKNGGE